MKTRRSDIVGKAGVREVHPNYSYFDEAKQFQLVFARYFPHLKEFLGDAAFEMEWLYTRTVRNPRYTVRRAKSRSDLCKLKSAIKFLAQHDMPYWHQACLVAVEAKSSESKVIRYQNDIFGFMMTLSEMEEDGLTEAVLQKYIDDAERGIEQLAETGNINWNAIHAVDGLRILWWRNTGTNAPSRALNPGSEFASFLRDGFAFFKIEGDPVSAFKRWAAKVGDTEVV